VRLDFHTAPSLIFETAGIAIDGAHAYFPILDVRQGSRRFFLWSMFKEGGV